MPDFDAKRLLDVLVAAGALALLSPIALLIAAPVRLFLGSPVLFRQLRPGLQGQPFVLFKFRTMLHAINERGEALPDADRLTRFGRFLRATSLDEVPQLWNVLRGDMSLVGPRPLMMQYLGRYSAQQARRHEVRPGITGWAQVNGRNTLDWPQKFSLDVWYVDNRSFWLDIKILLLTLRHVLLPRGISSDGSATMPEFMGQDAPDEDRGP